MKKEIIIFAKSIKHGGFCVAGKCTQTGEWIRPVSDEQGGAIANDQARATNPSWIHQNKSPYPIKLLYKIQIDFSKPVPFLHQQENWLNDKNYIWQHNFSLPVAQLNNYLDNPSNLWLYGSHQDRVPEFQIGNVSNSLYLVSVQNLHLFHQNNKRRASFCYNGMDYNLAVTDPNFDNIIQNCNKFQTAILCVSLGELFDGNYYKLVASIFI